MGEGLEKVALMGVKEIGILPFVCSDIKCLHEWETAIWPTNSCYLGFVFVSYHHNRL